MNVTAQALTATIERLEELLLHASCQADYLQKQQQGSLLDDLQATLTLLKGMIFTLNVHQMADIQKVVDQVETDNDKCVSLFKEAHLTIKRVVIRVGGEQLPNTHWVSNI